MWKNVLETHFLYTTTSFFYWLIMDSSHPFVVHYKKHSNKGEWPCCDICVIILCLICVHNAICDAHIIYGSTTLLTNIRILSWKLPPLLIDLLISNNFSSMTFFLRNAYFTSYRSSKYTRRPSTDFLLIFWHNKKLVK